MTTTKADWKVCVNGSDEYGYEVSICRESFPHGFQSYGWAGADTKIVLFEFRAHAKPEPVWEVILKYKDAHLIPFAQAAADAMNHVEQQSLLR